MTARSLLIRGMLVGVLAGFAAFVVARLVGEPPLSSAIALETVHDHAGATPELISRGVQSTVGLAAAVLFFGASIGGLFGIAYAFAQGRLGGLGARGTAASVAAIGFCALSFVPMLKYPANPPGIGNEDTLGTRTTLYFGAIAIAVLLTIACAIIARRLTPRLGHWNAISVGVALAVVLITAAYAGMPAVHETPAAFPAEVLWQFRVATVAIQATLWATMGFVFGLLTERSLRETYPHHVSLAMEQRLGEAAR